MKSLSESIFYGSSPWRLITSTIVLYISTVCESVSVWASEWVNQWSSERVHECVSRNVVGNLHFVIYTKFAPASIHTINVFKMQSLESDLLCPSKVFIAIVISWLLAGSNLVNAFGALYTHARQTREVIITDAVCKFKQC